MRLCKLVGVQKLNIDTKLVRGICRQTVHYLKYAILFAWTLIPTFFFKKKHLRWSAAHRTDLMQLGTWSNNCCSIQPAPRLVVLWRQTNNAAVLTHIKIRQRKMLPQKCPFDCQSSARQAYTLWPTPYSTKSGQLKRFRDVPYHQTTHVHIEWKTIANALAAPRVYECACPVRIINN